LSNLICWTYCEFTSFSPFRLLISQQKRRTTVLQSQEESKQCSCSPVLFPTLKTGLLPVGLLLPGPQREMMLVSQDSSVHLDAIKLKILVFQ